MTLETIQGLHERYGMTFDIRNGDVRAIFNRNGNKLDRTVVSIFCGFYLGNF